MLSSQKRERECSDDPIGIRAFIGVVTVVFMVGQQRSLELHLITFDNDGRGGAYRAPVHSCTRCGLHLIDHQRTPPWQAASRTKGSEKLMRIWGGTEEHQRWSEFQGAAGAHHTGARAPRRSPGAAESGARDDRRQLARRWRR